MSTILLIEDDETIRNMYSTGLTQEGFAVTTISNAAEAQALVENQQFDFILLDMLMSGMSGIDFLQSTDLQVKCPQTRVLALSNMGSEGVKSRAEALGVIAFLDKAEYDPPKLSNYLKSLG